MIREDLVRLALEWQARFGVAPPITSAVSEYDAAMLVGMTEDEYARGGAARTAVSAGFDFLHRGLRYQVKGSRPSGKPGSPVTKVAKANNYDWDRLIWVLYDTRFNLVEAWEWEVEAYRREFEGIPHVRPPALRAGRNLLVSVR